MVRRHPVAFAFVVAFAAWGGLACGALAEEVRLDGVAAGSLHEGPLEMVASTGPIDGEEMPVSASFAPRQATAVPMRVRMAMGEGDDVAFSMPGYPQVIYRFRRSGSELTVSVRPTGVAPAVAAGL